MFKGLNSIVIENQYLRCEWLPEYGSKLVSLKSNKDGDFCELLHQAKTPILRLPEYGADFTEFDMSGFDECFPTIDQCQFPCGHKCGITVPDHGELWTLAWEVVDYSDSEITFAVVSPQFGYRLEKCITLKNETLVSRYQLTLIDNQTKLPFIWTPHVLFQVNPNLRFIIPSHMDQIVTVSDNAGALGNNRTVHPYPNTRDLDQKPLDLSTIDSEDARNCEKYYFLNTLLPGDQFGFRDDYHEVIISVPSDKVPYLGIWKNQGGFNRDYNFALEPCTGIYDNLMDSYNQHSCAMIHRGEIYQWNFAIRVCRL